MQLPSRKNLVTRWIKKILLRGEKIPPREEKLAVFFFGLHPGNEGAASQDINATVARLTKYTANGYPALALPKTRLNNFRYKSSHVSYCVYIYISCVHMLKKDLKNMSIQLPMPGPHVTMHLRIPKMKVWKHLPALNQNWRTEETLQFLPQGYVFHKKKRFKNPQRHDSDMFLSLPCAWVHAKSLSPLWGVLPFGDSVVRAEKIVDQHDENQPFFLGLHTLFKNLSWKMKKIWLR